MKSSKGRSNAGENEDYTDNAIGISYSLESSSEFRILSNIRRTATTADRQFALHFRNKSCQEYNVIATNRYRNCCLGENIRILNILYFSEIKPHSQELAELNAILFAE